MCPWHPLFESLCDLLRADLSLAKATGGKRKSSSAAGGEEGGGDEKRPKEEAEF